MTEFFEFLFRIRGSRRISAARRNTAGKLASAVWMVVEALVEVPAAVSRAFNRSISFSISWGLVGGSAHQQVAGHQGHHPFAKERFLTAKAQRGGGSHGSAARLLR